MTGKRRNRKPSKKIDASAARHREVEDGWSRGLKGMLAAVSFIVAAVGFFAAVGYFWPRIQIDVEGKFDPDSPFPKSVSITNVGNIQLDQVFVLMRPSRIVSEGGGTIIGPSSGPGGITRPDWKVSHLAAGDKWTVPMGRNVAFMFGPISNGDISIVVNYWPWMLPKPPFLDWRKEARLVTHREPDGQMIWIARPR